MLVKETTTRTKSEAEYKTRRFASSELEQANALYSLLEDRFMNRVRTHSIDFVTRGQR